MSGDPLYCYPASGVLRNRLGITDAQKLDVAERKLVIDRAAEGAPTGKFDLTHLRAIHHHLFQDVSEWAGALREVEISKDGTTFMFRRYIETGMADVHRRIVEAGFLRNLDADRFAGKAGEIIGDINHIHSFREGNGRTQLTFLQQLADQASHVIDVRKIDGAAWYEASRAAHRGDFAPMGTAIRQAIVD